LEKEVLELLALQEVLVLLALLEPLELLDHLDKMETLVVHLFNSFLKIQHLQEQEVILVLVKLKWVLILDLHLLIGLQLIDFL
jgi:hypothetical protein